MSKSFTVYFDACSSAEWCKTLDAENEEEAEAKFWRWLDRQPKGEYADCELISGDDTFMHTEVMNVHAEET